MAPRGGVETSWQKYLREAQQRPGWSVARMARESNGAVSKATIFRMISGDTKKVATQTVLAIADVLGDPRDIALAAAGDLLVDDEAGGPVDWYEEMVERSRLPRTAKDALIAARRADVDAERRRAEEQLRVMESLQSE